MSPLFLKRMLCLIVLQKKKKLSVEDDNWQKLPYRNLNANDLEEIMPKSSLLSQNMVIPYGERLKKLFHPKPMKFKPSFG